MLITGIESIFKTVCVRLQKLFKERTNSSLIVKYLSHGIETFLHDQQTKNRPEILRLSISLLTFLEIIDLSSIRSAIHQIMTTTKELQISKGMVERWCF